MDLCAGTGPCDGLLLPHVVGHGAREAWLPSGSTVTRCLLIQCTVHLKVTLCVYVRVHPGCISGFCSRGGGQMSRAKVFLGGQPPLEINPGMYIHIFDWLLQLLCSCSVDTCTCTCKASVWNMEGTLSPTQGSSLFSSEKWTV